jgi:peptidoglycan/xylan/chitin deacetylase (PgdA/CDA1 family)
MKKPEINILTYHSISEGDGPTCISPRVFREQLDILEACGYKAVSLLELNGWFERKGETSSRLVALTFDDGYADFATEAFPALRARGWSATVFLPVAKIGGVNDWDSLHLGASLLPLMTWDAAADLGRQGIELGSHAMNHARLTRLPYRMAREEIAGSKRSIESITGCRVTSFAAPYGSTTRKLREEIKNSYRLAVGTRLAQAQPDSDPYDLPRIEMFYFQNPRHWRDYLEGRSKIYFNFRKALRALRNISITNWLERTKDR